MDRVGQQLARFPHRFSPKTAAVKTFDVFSRLKSSSSASLISCHQEEQSISTTPPIPTPNTTAFTPVPKYGLCDVISSSPRGPFTSNSILQNLTNFPSSYTARYFHRSSVVAMATATDPASRKEGVASPGEQPSEDDEEEKSLTLSQRFRKLFKQYGFVLIPVHVATTAVWATCFYYVAKSGFDVLPMLDSLHVPDVIMDPVRNHRGASDFVVAYALYKVATPLRYMVTIGGTTFTVRYLRRKGLMAPPPPKMKNKNK